MVMTKLALAVAATAALAFATPAFATNGTSTLAPTIQLAQADVTIRVGPRPRVKKTVVVRRDRWRRCRTVTVRTRSAGQVVVKRIRRCR
jgi:hypothetical protein